MITSRLRLGKRKAKRLYGGWTSDWIKPCGKFWKRQASKKFRKYENAKSGCFHKKVYDGLYDGKTASDIVKTILV